MEVSFTVTGANSASGTATTDSSGQCTFSYVGIAEGDDTIVATATIDGKQVSSNEVSKTWEITILTVDIDVKPGSWSNSINLNGNGVVPIGVFGSPTFDVANIDVSTVLAGVTGTEAAPVHEGHLKDINADGMEDMVFHFREFELGIPTGTQDNTEMPLYIAGKLNTGVSFMGQDIIRITPNDESSRGKGGNGPK